VFGIGEIRGRLFRLAIVQDGDSHETFLHRILEPRVIISLPEFMSRRFSIGRDRRSDVPIADDSVSRLHAEIWLADDGSLMMADRGSSNGTTILRNGASFPLREDVILPGDVIRLGSVALPVPEIVGAVEARQP